MNVSITNLSVWSPYSHFVANPVSVCLNCLSVSFSFCILEKNLILSIIMFLSLLKASPQLVCYSCSVTIATLISENLSVTLFLPAVPNDRKRTLTTFISAACSLRLFFRAKFLGACSVTILKNSFTDFEYLIFTDTVKRSHESSQSVLGAASAESQFAGYPDTADALPDFATSPQLADSRSAML